ncbi:MAG: hypothetical protein ACKOGJ_01980, partial [Phycisphaerales bacterium]
MARLGGVVVAIVLVAAAWLSGPARAQATAQPGAIPPATGAAAQASVVVVEPPLIDFGRVAPGSRHPARFMLRNVSG